MIKNTMSGIQYTRIITDSSYNLGPDIKLLICSYLSLEEVLTIFLDDTTTRDKIIRLYYKKLPDIDLASQNGDLETVKYLFGKGIRPTYYTIGSASYYGHLEVVKYLYEKGIVPTSYAIEYASRNGHLEVVKYLCENGMEVTNQAIVYAFVKGNMRIVNYLKDIFNLQATTICSNPL